MVPGIGLCRKADSIRISYLERQGNGVRVIREGEEFLLYKEKLLVGRCGCTRQNEGWRLGPLWVDQMCIRDRPWQAVVLEMEP